MKKEITWDRLSILQLEKVYILKKFQVNPLKIGGKKRGGEETIIYGTTTYGRWEETNTHTHTHTTIDCAFGS